MENHENNSGFEPGAWSDSFSGFQPEMPEGSWDRLQERRKKRRRLPLFWWLFGIGLGLSIWGSRQLFFQPSESETTHIQSISTTSTQAEVAPKGETKSSDAKENQRLSPTGKNFSSAHSSSLRTESDQTKPLTTSGSGAEIPRSILRKKTNRLLVKPSKDHALSANLSYSIPNKNANNQLKEIADAPTNQNQNPKSKTLIRKGSPEDGLASNLNKNLSITASGQTQKQESPATENPGMPLLTVNSSTEKQDLKPDSGMENSSRKDSLPAQSDSLSIPADSLRKQPGQPIRFRIESGLLALALNQQLDVAGAAAEDKISRKLLSVNPGLGMLASLRARWLLSKRWFIAGGVQLGWLQIRSTWQTQPGPNADFRFVQTGNEIQAIPIQTPDKQTENRNLAFAGLGFELGHQLTPSLEIRTGIQHHLWKTISGKGADPSEKLPAILLAAQYQFHSHWRLRTEVLAGKGSQFLSALSSQSQHLRLGLGLIRAW